MCSLGFDWCTIVTDNSPSEAEAISTWLLQCCGYPGQRVKTLKATCEDVAGWLAIIASSRESGLRTGFSERPDGMSIWLESAMTTLGPPNYGISEAKNFSCSVDRRMP